MRVNADRCANRRDQRPRSAYCETAVPEVWKTTRVGGAIWLTSGSITTDATPTRFISRRVGSTRRAIEDASASVWTPVVDFDDDRVAVAEIRHLRG